MFDVRLSYHNKRLLTYLLIITVSLIMSLLVLKPEVTALTVIWQTCSYFKGVGESSPWPNVEAVA